MGTKQGLYVPDTEAVRRHIVGLHTGIQEFTAKMSTFLASMRELKDVGKNISELEPIFEAMTRELKLLEETNTKVVSQFAGYMISVTETEDTSVKFD